jgi:hypothetical protein
MRRSVGVDPAEVESVARAIQKGLERYYRNSRLAMAQWKLRENGPIHANGNGLVKANGNGLVAANGNGAFKTNGNYFEPVDGN